jgi:hypothetical protein
VKFDPTTFMVTLFVPAAIVCGRIWLMLGVPDKGAIPDPQPAQNRMKANITPVTDVFNTFAKIISQ